MSLEISSQRVATYARVSSEEQAERGTIATQRDELQRWLERHPGVVLVEDYKDDGISGTVPLAERRSGARLMRDAALGRFSILLVYKVDRLGRDAVDLLQLRRRLDGLGITLVSVVEGETDLLSYDIQAAVADHYRREFLRRTADGLNRAAREGRYIGGIVAFGYRSVGEKGKARLEPDTAPLWADRSAAELVRQIYQWIGPEGWSCVRVARELTLLGVPTHYVRDGRLLKEKTGERRQRTQGVWRAGRIRNMVVSPTYKGELLFGKRSDHPREVVSAEVEGLVSPELWLAAQETLARNRVCAKNTPRRHLLRSVIRCATCGLHYVGSQGREGVAWYRCNGSLQTRGRLQGRCPAKALRGPEMEALVWDDIARFLKDPGEILAELEAGGERDTAAALAKAESLTLTRALDELAAQWQRAVGLVVRGVLDEVSLRPELARIAAERNEIDRRLAALAPAVDEGPVVSAGLLDELRLRVDAGLDDEQRQEIVRLLVAQISVTTDVHEDGTKHASATISYRFPGVVPTRTGSGSWPRRALARASPRGRG